MRYWKRCLGLVIGVLTVSFSGFAQDYDLQYFLAKSSSKESVLSKTDRMELLRCLDELLDRADKIRPKLAQMIQGGEVDFRYQEGQFWLSKLKEDGTAIETAMQQIKLLRDRPLLLVPSIRLYKSLKDLSRDYTVYNNMPSFSAVVGDLAPEIELWVDPVFFQLCLLPLASMKDKEAMSKPPPPKESPKEKEKKPVPKVKKP